MDSDDSLPQFGLDTSNVNIRLALTSGVIGIAVSAATYFLAEVVAAKTVMNANAMLREAFESGEFTNNRT